MNNYSKNGHDPNKEILGGIFIFGSTFFFCYFVGSFIALAWLLYQGFSPNSKLNRPEPEEKSNNSEKQ